MNYELTIYLLFVFLYELIFLQFRKTFHINIIYVCFKPRVLVKSNSQSCHFLYCYWKHLAHCLKHHTKIG